MICQSCGEAAISLQIWGESPVLEVCPKCFADCDHEWEIVYPSHCEENALQYCRLCDKVEADVPCEPRPRGRAGFLAMRRGHE